MTGKSEIKVLADFVSSEDSLSCSLMALSHCVLTEWNERSLWCLFLKGTNLIGSGSTFKASFNLT